MESPESVFESHRAELTRIAYRMLGSVADAEDIVQDAYLRWSNRGDEDVVSPRAFLRTIVTRLCLDEIRAAKSRRMDYTGPWLPEPIVSSRDDRLELAESVSFALLVLLENLSAEERAAYLLKRMFDCEYAEIARTLDMSEGACRQLVSRAEKRLRARNPRFAANSATAEKLADRFLHAGATGDLESLLGVLTDEAVLISDGGGKRLAARAPIYGAERIARFLMGIAGKAPANQSIVPVQVNESPGFLVYWGSELHSAITFDFDGDRICSVYFVVNPDKLGHIAQQAKNATV